MSRTEEDCLFLEEDAKWLPLDASLLAVRECLHKLIGGVREAIPYFKGETSNAPAEELSRRFAAIYTHGSTAFEDMCDRLKMFGPSEIPDSKAQPILRLGRILASAVEELLTIAEVSDLRDAMESLSNLACNTPKSCPADVYANRVEGTRESIHRGFRSLTDGFRKLEHQMREGSTKTSSLVDEIRTVVAEEADRTIGVVNDHAKHTDERIDILSTRVKTNAHETKLARKGQMSVKKYAEEEQAEIFKMWLESVCRFGQAHAKEDGFKFFGGKLRDYGIDNADEWKRVVEQYRCRKNLKIRNEVEKYSASQTEKISLRGREAG